MHMSEEVDTSEDLISYLEIARIAMSTIPDELIDELDIDGSEYVRLRDNLQETMDNCDSDLRWGMNYHSSLLV